MMKNDTISVKLRPVKKSDCDFLYDLLKEKDPRANISHKMMPSFSKWYVIEVSTNNIGSIYLTQNNEIGISIKNDFEAKEIISQIINLLIKKHPRSKYFVNVNPKNGKYIQFLKNHKFHLIQHTYQLDK